MELISIIVPVYNAEKTITKCVKSLLDQSYNNTEIILINDFSKDKSKDICEDFANNHRNIFLHNNEKNIGVSATRNKGIELSGGKYVCFVDSDDYVERNYLQNLYNYRMQNDTMPICGFIYHNEVDKRNPKAFGWKEKDGLVGLDRAFELYDEQYLTALWNKLLDKEVIDLYDIRFDEDLAMGEDLRFSVEYLQKANIDKIFAFSDPLYHYTKLTSTSLMSEFAKYGLDIGIKNLLAIKGLVEKFNKNADIEYNKRVDVLKQSLIYHIIRERSFSISKRINEVKKINSNFSFVDYIFERIKYYKEWTIGLFIR